MTNASVCDFLIAGSYFFIALKLLIFASNSTVRFLHLDLKLQPPIQLFLIHITQILANLQGGRTRSFFFSAMSLFLVCASFFALSGATHLVHGFTGVFPNSRAIYLSHSILTIMCTVVSIATVVAIQFFLPTIIRVLSEVHLRNRQYELNESYMVDVMNRLKESVLELSSQYTIVRGNAVSSSIFGPGFAGQHLPSMVHHDDRALLEQSMRQVLTSAEDAMPITVEYRVKSNETSVTLATSLSTGYRWVESSLCKGATLLPDGSTCHDVKMISRSVDELKRTAHYRKHYHEVKEREAINEAKLRYISCIATT
jgi:hypothetical protein